MVKYIVVLLFSWVTFAQQDTSYTFGTGESEKIEFKKYLNQFLNEQVAGINSDDFEDEQELIYENQAEGLMNKLIDSSFIQNNNLHDRVGLVFDEIFRANPELKKTEFKVLFDKTMFPNASAYGSGLFCINLGLFSLLESEDELAFVICHELAHHYLNHARDKVFNYVSTINSVELKERAKAIKRMKYGQGTAGMELIKDLSFNLSAHSREAELEADAQGLAYFSKTKYNKKAVQSALEKLGKLEELIFKDKPDWITLFNTENYKFNMGWLEAEESLFDTNEVIDDLAWDKDSIRTHPHASERLEKIIPMIQNSGNGVSQENYKVMQQLATNLSILAAIETNKLDFALYMTAVKLGLAVEDKRFYQVTMSRILMRIHELKGDHDLGRFVPVANDLSDEVYLNDVRRFIHAIEMYDLKKLAQAYMEKCKPQCGEQEEFIHVYQYFNQ